MQLRQSSNLSYKDGVMSDSEYLSKKYGSYRTLWIRVYIRAVFDFVQYQDVTDVKLRRHAEDAHRWLFEPAEGFNSFEHICEVFDLPLATLRSFARKITKEDVKRMEHIDGDGLILRAQEHIAEEDSSGDDQ
jgi:hypothetical protein